jgi:hypothetical protein
MSSNDMAPPGYKIYPGATPEFRLFKKSDGRIEQHVRYIKPEIGYTGKWMVVQIIKEETSNGGSSTSST